MSETRSAIGSAQASRRTPLFAVHAELGARMVAFAGYELPVSYPTGILAEHRHTRAKASLFDVSHMGQIVLADPSAGRALESLVPADLAELSPGRMRYTMLTSPEGGILDDVIVTNLGDRWALVVNAARKHDDAAHLKAHLSGRCLIEGLTDRALLALQGPASETVLARFNEACRDLAFMTAAPMPLAGAEAIVSRSGYTGEDGFEISLASGEAEALARKLLAEPEVEPAGLGARDSLRLEAGLCLYGQDIDSSTTPVEAGLVWTIGKQRRETGGFPGAETILRQMKEGPPRKRVGIRPEDAVPARAHTEIRDGEGRRVGEVTSGGFGPTLEAPVAMGYVEASHAAPGTELKLMIRGKAHDAKVASLPFVEHRYRRS